MNQWRSISKFDFVCSPAVVEGRTGRTASFEVGCRNPKSCPPGVVYPTPRCSLACAVLHAQQSGASDAFSTSAANVEKMLRGAARNTSRSGAVHLTYALPCTTAPPLHDLPTPKSGNIFRVGSFILISPAHLRVHTMGRTCMWVGEVGLTPIGVELNGSQRVHGPVLGAAELLGT